MLTGLLFLKKDGKSGWSLFFEKKQKEKKNEKNVNSAKIGKTLKTKLLSKRVISTFAVCLLLLMAGGIYIYQNNRTYEGIDDSNKMVYCEYRNGQSNAIIHGDQWCEENKTNAVRPCLIWDCDDEDAYCTYCLNEKQINFLKKYIYGK